MRNRRFLLLAATLVALNVSLWIVPQGLALQRVVVASLFGKNLMRADVTEQNGSETRLARGIVVSNKLGVLTVQEADTKTESISVSSSTKVTVPVGTKAVKVGGIKPGWRVLATWPISGGVAGTADSVAVEKRKSS
jgi:hypothetical protein